jgi:DNA ligase-associated metallophosphoesterase
VSTAVAEVAGERLVLLSERAAYWERTGTLLVADPHFGKAAAFRAAGVLVPRGTTMETLSRLDVALSRTATVRIVFLGDFLHAKEGRAPETLRTLNEWRERWSSVEMVLVRGNHDARAGDPPKELRIRCESGRVAERPFVFAHHPVRSDDGYVLAGHIHPGVTLRGAGKQASKLPCFWFGPETAVLPAFGEFTGLAVVRPVEGDRVWVVGDGSVVSVTPS